VLTCKAKGAPDVSFNWSRKGAVINVEKSEGKYEVASKMVDR
jgi:RNA polymerase subunit RPABC4/transcription elongation factor Spt4